MDKIVTVGEVRADVYQEQTPSEVDLQFTARPSGDDAQLVRNGEPQRPEVRPELAAVVQHHERAQPLPHVMQVIGLQERRRPRLASAGRPPAGSM